MPHIQQLSSFQEFRGASLRAEVGELQRHMSQLQQALPSCYPVGLVAKLNLSLDEFQSISIISY